jgi:hypothetical protein
MTAEGEQLGKAFLGGGIPEEQSYTELARGFDNVTVSRQQALKLFTGALLGAGLLAALPSVAEAVEASGGPTGPIGRLEGSGGATGGGTPGGDTTRPTVVRVIPANGATGISRRVNVRAKFSEAMNAASINGNTFRLYEGNFTYTQLNDTNNPLPPGSEEAAGVSYNATKKLAVLNPSRRLAANTTYTAVVEGVNDSDGKAVKDEAGNALARDCIWHFRTGT